MSTSTRTRLTALHPSDGKVYLRTGNPALGGTGRRELWGAISHDRTWRYRREDQPGTPWALDRWNPDAAAYLEVDTGFGTLRAAREATADPRYCEELRARILGLPRPAPAPQPEPAPVRWVIEPRRP